MRPRTRGECIDGARPCPFVSCRHHLGLDVNPRTGTIKFNAGHVDSCSLDVADRGPSTLTSIAARLHVTRERVRQIEALGLRKLARLEVQ